MSGGLARTYFPLGLYPCARVYQVDFPSGQRQEVNIHGLQQAAGTGRPGPLLQLSEELEQRAAGNRQTCWFVFSGKELACAVGLAGKAI